MSAFITALTIIGMMLQNFGQKDLSTYVLVLAFIFSLIMAYKAKGKKEIV